MTIGEVYWTFDWVNAGDWVYVWDSSGITPPDPNIFASGGF